MEYKKIGYICSDPFYRLKIHIGLVLTQTLIGLDSDWKQGLGNLNTSFNGTDSYD